MGKKLLNLWIYSGLAAVMLLCCQCKQEVDARTKEIRKYLKTKYDTEPGKETDRIYIINDMGCGNCILSLSEFVKQHVNDHQAMIIIHSRGTNVDLNAFEGKKKNNSHIFINHQAITDENDPFYHSGVVYLTEGKVDTVVNIANDRMVEQLEYIFSRETQKKR